MKTIHTRSVAVLGEGKIHLGYVYGNEPGRATADLMVEGALSFASLIDRWMPRPVDWKAIRSDPFMYAILGDTMVSPDKLAEHYQWVDVAIDATMGIPIPRSCLYSSPWLTLG